VSALALKSAVRSDRGAVRADNEDSAYASTRLAAVADGVGGRAAGEVASAAVINELILMDKCRLAEPLEAALERAVASGNASVGFIARCHPEMAGMSTTVTAVALDERRYAIANVGDSRAYLYRDGRLRQLTRDDSYVQELIDRGALDPRAARTHPQRSVVLKALDGDPAVTPAISSLEAEPGDRMLVCSDGLSDLIDERELASALALDSREASAERLIELALAAGGSDNVSVVVADVVARERASDGWLPSL
jgi:protein phosphatase